jgi:hypothetical protein
MNNREIIDISPSPSPRHEQNTSKTVMFPNHSNAPTLRDRQGGYQQSLLPRIIIFTSIISNTDCGISVTTNSSSSSFDRK